jgi:hypothetical protein
MNGIKKTLNIKEKEREILVNLEKFFKDKSHIFLKIIDI